MKRMSLCAAVVVMAWVAAGTAQEPAADGKSLALVQVGDLREGIMERVRAFVETNTRVPTRVLEAREPAGKTLAEEAEALAGLAGPEVLYLVGVVAAEGTTEHSFRPAGGNIAVVNSRAMREGEPDNETYARRMERQVMQSIGLLAGVEHCPNPQCALFEYGNFKELDLMSRNFCPPCADRVRKAAMKQGGAMLDAPATTEEPGAPPPLPPEALPEAE